jgi:phosphocarrier protein
MNALFSPPLPDTRSVSAQTVRRTFRVNLEHGLHARPCALLIKTIRPYSAEVLVEANGEEASGHSIMGLMALAAGPGTEVTFTAKGADALEVMAAIQHLFETQFKAAYRVTGPALAPAVCFPKANSTS